MDCDFQLACLPARPGSSDGAELELQWPDAVEILRGSKRMAAARGTPPSIKQLYNGTRRIRATGSDDMMRRRSA